MSQDPAPPRRSKSSTPTSTATEPRTGTSPEDPPVKIQLSAEQRAVRIHELMSELIPLYRETLEARNRPLRVRRPADMAMDEFDLTVVWEIAIHSQTDTPVTMRGRSTLSEALHPDLLPQTMRTAQQLVMDAVVTPLNTKLMRFLGRIVMPHDQAGGRIERLSSEMPERVTLPQDFNDDFNDDFGGLGNSAESRDNDPGGDDPVDEEPGA